MTKEKQHSKSGWRVKSDKEKERLRSMASNRLGKGERVSKSCNKCGIFKQAKDFKLLKNGYLGPYCLECVRAISRENWERNKDRIRVRQADYRARNIVDVRNRKREQIALLRKEKPELARLMRANANANRRALLRSVHGNFSSKDIFQIGEYQSWKCSGCFCDISSSYQVDHIQPLSKGGSNDKENLQLLCRTCNLSKRAKTPLEFMVQRSAA